MRIDREFSPHSTLVQNGSINSLCRITDFPFLLRLYNRFLLLHLFAHVVADFHRLHLIRCVFCVAVTALKVCQCRLVGISEMFLHSIKQKHLIAVLRWNEKCGKQNENWFFSLDIIDFTNGHDSGECIRVSINTLCTASPYAKSNSTKNITLLCPKRVTNSSLFFGIAKSEQKVSSLLIFVFVEESNYIMRSFHISGIDSIISGLQFHRWLLVSIPSK